MTKIMIDLTTLPLKLADRFREGVQSILDMGDTKTRFKDGKTKVEFDYGYNDLTRFTYTVYEHPVKLLREACDNTRDASVIVERFGTDTYKVATKELLETARDACRDLDYPDDPDDLEDTLDQSTTAAIADVLNDADGFILGGSHNDNTHRDPIVDALESGAISAANGTGLLFIEEISSFVQEEIDAFLASPDDEMPALLSSYLSTLKETQGKFDFAGMIRLAKEKGVRVVGIDTAESKILEDVPSAVHHEQRCAKMNVDAADIMEQARIDARADGKPDKFVALVGAAHVNTHEGGVPGLAQLLGVPGLEATAGGKLKRVDEDQTKRGMPPKEQADFIDAYLKALNSKLDGAEMDWREQREVALEHAQFLTASGFLLPATNIDNLIEQDGVQDHLTQTKDDMVQRAAGKAELAQLIKDGDTAQFSARLLVLAAADPKFLKYDLSAEDPSLAALAIQSGLSDLVTDCATAGAPIGDADESDLLIKAAMQAHVTDQNAPGITPADAQIRFSHAVGVLLTAGIDPNGANQKGNTPLQALVQAGYGAQAGQLIDGGGDATAMDKNHESMLELAITAGSADTVAALAARGGNIDKMTGDGSLLQNALRDGKTDIALALLIAGAGANRPAGPDGNTELHLAIALGDQSIIDNLVAAGADVTATDANGETAMDAFLLAQITKLAEEATNGPHRAVLAKEDEIAGKQDEIAAGQKELDALGAEQDRIAKDKVDGKIDAATATNQLLDIITNQIPAVNAAQAQRGVDLATFQGQLPALKAANPLNPHVTAFADLITALERSLEGMTEEDQAPVKAQIRDEKSHLERLSAAQPVDPELVRVQFEAMKATIGAATLGAVNTIADMRNLVDTDPTVAATVTDLQGKLIDRQSDVIEISEAVRKGDLVKIEQLLASDPSLINARVPNDPHEFTLLHLAAVRLDEDTVATLLAHNPDLELETDDGCTAMHKLFHSRKDQDEDKLTQALMINALLIAGADIDHQDSMGMTCLHLACLDGNPDAVTNLINLGADETLIDNRGWTAKDVVTATTKPMTEEAYAEASDYNQSRPLIGDDEVSVDTIEILMRATKCEDPSDVARVREMLDGLYAQPEFRPILQLVALDAANARDLDVGGASETGLRIFVADNKQVGLLFNSASESRKTNKPDSPRGAYEETSNIVMLGASQEDGHFTAGTLIHELTHAATRLLYGNEDRGGPTISTS